MPDPYVFQEYPKWKYKAGAEAVIVECKEEEDALDPGFGDLPSSTDTPEELEQVAEIEVVKKSKRGSKA